ncbi:uncharacterized protein [Periplaneta americana]|uniref:uncharacterized protein n=1 Tax=Periplaneta americana TaxID=6978 RepID=UPI0037E72F34
MEVPSSRGQDRSRGHHAGVSRGPGGAVRRRGTPIPVLPPRVPTPVPSADSRGSNSTHLEPEPPPPPPPVSQQRDIAHLATRYLEDNVKAWINPRIYAKLDHEAITSPDYVFKTRATNNHHHYHQPHNKHHQSKSQRGSKEDPKSSYLGNGTTEEHDAVGEIHRSPTAALLSSNGQQNGCGETRTVSGSRPGTRDGSSSGVVIKHHHNHHHGGDMSGKHVVSPADSTSRNTHQSAVVFNGKQSTTMLTNSYQQKACVKNSVVNPTINANGVAVSNGNSSAMPQTKISNKGSASQRMLSPGDEVGGYGRHQPPKPSPRSHHYTGHSSVVDFLYGGLDGLSTSPTLVLTPGMGAGTPSSSYYSESKYAYSVSGVPGTPAQSSAAAAFFARKAASGFYSTGHKNASLKFYLFPVPCFLFPVPLSTLRPSPGSIVKLCPMPFVAFRSEKVLFFVIGDVIKLLPMYYCE